MIMSKSLRCLLKPGISPAESSSLLLLSKPAPLQRFKIAIYTALRRLRIASNAFQVSAHPQALRTPLRASGGAFVTTCTFGHTLISKVPPSRFVDRSRRPDLAFAALTDVSESLLSALRCQHTSKTSERLSEPLRASLRAPAIDRGSNTNTTLDIYLTT